VSVAHRVAVTGIGVVTPLGIGKEIFWQTVLAERVAVDVVRGFDTTGYRSKLAAEITDFNPRDFLSDKRQRWTDRFSQFAVAAARLSLDDATFYLQRRDRIRFDWTDGRKREFLRGRHGCDR
jgi:3-oxoacyl-[acyl-carrier-protein] synthase II